MLVIFDGINFKMLEVNEISNLGFAFVHHLNS